MKQTMTTTRFFMKFGLPATAIILTLTALALLHRSEKSVTAETPPKPDLARWSGQTQISAKQRGNPWINVRNGEDLLTDLAGAAELRASFENNQSRPLSLAAADFDEDGTPDIIAGYTHNNRGAASLLRGNVDAVYPNSPEAIERKAKGEFTDAPFTGPAQLFTLPVAPHFLAAGDFDADGHFDIAAAARTETAVYFLKGDGRGELVLSKRIELPGKVTAVLAEDFNRRDGVHDLIVAVRNDQNSQVLIYENPYGASRAVPEIFTFAQPVTSLAVHLIEGDARYDLAIAAGNELAVLRGRDRKLLFDGSGKQSEAIQMTRRKFDFQIDALAVGDFIKSEIPTNEIVLLSKDGRIHLLEKSEPSDGSDSWREKQTVSLPENLSNEAAPVMLTARVSARSVDTLVVGAGSRIHLLTSDITPPKSETEAINYDAQKFELAASLDVASRLAAILPMRLNIDALSDLVVMREDSVAPTIVQTAPMATFTVDSNANVDDPRLSDGICAIAPCPIDGNLPCTGPCTYLAARQQANFSSGSHLINFAVPVAGTPTFLAPQSGILNPLTIDGTTQPGGFVQFTGVSNQFPATHFTGSQTDNCVFRGMVANGFVGNNIYINLQSDNHIVEGNRIGTNVAGTAAPGGTNGNGGVNAGGEGNLIGGTTAAARNIISTADLTGVTVGSAPAGNPNRVQGNFIGTDVTGTVALGNRGFGVQAAGENILIGGTTAGAGNLVSGTTGTLPFFVGAGINPSGGIGLLVQGNRIGTNANGTAALGNTRNGIYLTTSGSFDTIGGIVPSARNIISGNGADGLEINPSASNLSQVLGNYIGTNAAGNAAIPNGGFGLEFNQGTQKLISDNLISGNNGGGIQFCCNGGGDVISGNLIGTDATGTGALGNGGVGLSVSSGGTGGFTQSSTISGNTIAANTSHGVFSDNAASLIFQNNFIGTNSSLSQTMGNGGDGMRINGAFRSSQIGGAGAGNTIAFNAGNGINLATPNIGSTENRITDNSIYSNGGLGIDLGGDGVSANDNCDGENGPNTLQNYPTISAVSLSGASNVRIVGRINTTANQSYTLHFYANLAADASGFGEGRQFIGTTSVVVPAGCQANFSATLPRTLAGARCISATATDGGGNTSEFSSCVPIRTAIGDYDNDGLADLTVWRPSNGTWYNLQSSNGAFRATQFGQTGDRPAPGDFDGNGQMDYAVFRPSSGIWLTLFNPNGNFSATTFGISSDTPVAGDYDGDGVDDIAVRRNDGNWYLLRSNSGFAGFAWGFGDDRPLSSDYDGDGKNDLAVFRPSNGGWYILNSRNNTFTATNFGLGTDRTTPADYDGDGKTDIAVFRPSNGVWYLLQSSAGFSGTSFGIGSDTPVPADYDGDGRADIAVYRGGTWYLLRSTAGFSAVQFGAADDVPIPAKGL